MRLRNGTFLTLLLFCLCAFLSLSWYAALSGQKGDVVDVYQREFLALRDRLHAAEQESLKRSKELNLVLDEIKRAVSERQALREGEGNRTWGRLTEDPRLKPWNVSHKHVLHLPTVFHHLPHLLAKESSLQPAVRVGQGRTGVSVVMGIPSVRREVHSYLTDTLHSLISELSPQEKEDSVIVVLIAETDPQYTSVVTENIKALFPTEIHSGLLEVISPSPHFYPDFSHLRESFGDPKERVRYEHCPLPHAPGHLPSCVRTRSVSAQVPGTSLQCVRFSIGGPLHGVGQGVRAPEPLPLPCRWRTKQNLDYCFLMMYAQSKGIYYVQLEDDIVAKPNYLSTMKNFALQQPSEDWMILEFSQLGFIGKMFKSLDLSLIVEFILMFYRDKPIDWLLDHILWVKVCNPEKDAKHCDRQKANLRIRFKPSLFQHVGTHSSLAGKIQKLKDKDFGKQALRKEHVNPPAEVSTSLKTYQHFTLEKAYLREDFFWAFTPTAGDFIRFRFFQPLRLERFFFRSGNIEHPEDKLFNTSVEVLPFDNPQSDKEALQEGRSATLRYPRSPDGYLQIGSFYKGVAEGEVDPAFGPLEALRLSIQTDSPVWVILSEIFLKKAD
ncbi:alpha-1,3-mannosyl-glycoprotein 4-beta-N-acetylglucosaminyltransferase B isoform X2 [Neomonachus schauinslandi]|uniref:Alpha-1,3-mannosyl-glycoprotein 4-beta-N-acetylglucosaminyltransferase B isoform X2 n=1 Tax=Neomonachus schauinslandi TaxID=29088 RepID=A0A8M1MKB4_NEOSC|nr:alpha-1,3-mannosyl-glycoprotein 4-beta-N-acetylglucosaminyltransferase B isoform X2 [Neomonachus schauinslandi]